MNARFAMLHRSYPLLFRILVWLVAPISLALMAGYGYLAKSLPPESGTLRVTGLTSKVTVVRDAHAVPHIRAATDRDAFFAIGYLHAQERMWQMEYQRLLGQGRLSEVLGAENLKSDQFMRTLGLYRAAQRAVQSLDESARATLMAYVDGVNAWISERHVLPLEYHILGIEPEPWRSEDSLLQIKLMALDMDFNHYEELTFDLLVKHLGPLKAVDLMPNYTPAHAAASARSQLSEAVVAGLMARADAMKLQLDIGGERLGSNAWAVAGELTRSGYPMLANDPHLATEIPSVWYLAEIHGERLHVAGATYPGLPFVILGRNDAIAWGATALGGDVQDLYMERSNPNAENQYEVDGEWTDMEVEEHWIKVKSEFPTFLTEPIPPLRWIVRRTRHGPLITDAIERVATPMALKWTALDADDGTYESFLGINYAQDWREFKLAVADYVAPTVNFVYADRGGNIAQIAGGRLPIRQGGDGRLPVAGWESKSEWVAYIPIDEVPQSLNPPEGYIVSANNANHGPAYPYLISNSWAPPYRAERIRQEIEGRTGGGRRLGVEDSIEIQGDVKSLQAEQLLAFLRRLTPRTQEQRGALEQLAQWDGTIAEGSASAALYQSWLRHFNRLVVNDDLIGDFLRPERLDALQLFAERLNPVFLQRTVGAATGSGHNWCDQVVTTRLETCEHVALVALDDAADELLSLTGAARQWGDVHETYYEHRGFADVQLLDFIFDREIASGGDGYSVNVGGWKYSKDAGYRQSIGPSYRQVIDLHDFGSSRFINNTGQSGNVLSEHYDDYVSLHKRLELLPMRVRSKDELAGAVTLVLEPAAARAGEP